MLRAFSLALFFITFEGALACKLVPSKTYVSFSAPITHLLEELKLLEDKSLEAISNYHSVQNSKVKKLHGGIFLAPKKLMQMKDSIVFYDESRELSRTLKHSDVKGAVEVVTRELDPFMAFNASVQKLSPSLIGCNKELSELKDKVDLIKKEALKKNLPKKTFIFYLGKISKSGKKPKLLIANDGIVKFMKEKLSMLSYPSNLAYVPPSSRILSGLSKPISIGLYESREKLEITEVSTDSYNIGFPNSLKPGITQVYFLEALLELKLFRVDG